MNSATLFNYYFGGRLNEENSALLPRFSETFTVHTQLRQFGSLAFNVITLSEFIVLVHFSRLISAYV